MPPAPHLSRPVGAPVRKLDGDRVGVLPFSA